MRGTSTRLLLPHNEHLSLVPVLVFKALFSTVGIDSYVPYRVAGLALHCGVVVLLFVYARRRVGDVLALAAAATVLFLGTAWPDVLWPFQIGFLGSLAAGIGALLALDREDRRGDITAAVLLAVALASSSLGIPLLFAFALEVLGRPDRARAGGSSWRPRRALRAVVRGIRRRLELGDERQPLRLALVRRRGGRGRGRRAVLARARTGAARSRSGWSSRCC